MDRSAQVHGKMEPDRPRCRSATHANGALNLDEIDVDHRLSDKGDGLWHADKDSLDKSRERFQPAALIFIRYANCRFVGSIQDDLEVTSPRTSEMASFVSFSVARFFY